VRVVLILAVTTSCSALTSLDDLSSGADGSTGSDSGGSDVANANDVVQTNDAGGDAGGNLVANGGFENGQGGCGTNWGNGYSGTFTRVSPGHTGSNACLVCTSFSNPDSYQIDAIGLIPVQAGNYYAEAWLGTPWDGGFPTAKVGVQIYFVGDAGTISGCPAGDGKTYCQGSFVSAPPWTTSSVSFVVAGSGQLKLDVHSYAGDAGTCFVVDDVAVYAQ
jgi:hypothetical protein